MTYPHPARAERDDPTIHLDPDAFHEIEGEGFDLEERNALRRVSGIRTDLEDVTEVEYRQLRLERVVLMGVYPRGEDADVSLFELKALAETAGCEVLEGLLQRKDFPDPKSYVGSGKAQELRDVVLSTGADTVICDGELRDLWAAVQLRQPPGGLVECKGGRSRDQEQHPADGGCCAEDFHLARDRVTSSAFSSSRTCACP